MSETNHRLPDRRAFLKLAGLGSFAGGATLGAPLAAMAATPAEPAAKDGYRETGHVRQVYRLARF